MAQTGNILVFKGIFLATVEASIVNELIVHISMMEKVAEQHSDL